MTCEPESDGETEYAVPLAHRVRVWVGVGALGTVGAGIVLDHPEWCAVPICLYVIWMFLRHWLAKRAFERTWTAGGGTVERMR